MHALANIDYGLGRQNKQYSTVSDTEGRVHTMRGCV